MRHCDHGQRATIVSHSTSNYYSLYAARNLSCNGTVRTLLLDQVARFAYSRNNYHDWSGNGLGIIPINMRWVHFTSPLTAAARDPATSGGWCKYVVSSLATRLSSESWQSSWECENWGFHRCSVDIYVVPCIYSRRSLFQLKLERFIIITDNIPATTIMLYVGLIFAWVHHQVCSDSWVTVWIIIGNGEICSVQKCGCIRWTWAWRRQRRRRTQPKGRPSRLDGCIAAANMRNIERDHVATNSEIAFCT